MQHIDSLLYARWVIPIEPHNTFLENQALAIHEGKILGILPIEKAKDCFQAQEILEFPSHAILPGLVNSHTHSPMTLFRGLADDLALMDWLNNHIWPAEKKWLSEKFVYDGTELAMLEMLRSGTTCFNENYFFADTIAKAVVQAGMRACIGETVLDFATNYGDNADDYIIKTQKLYEEWKDHSLIKMSIAPHAPYTLSDESFLKVKNFADERNLIIHLHLHETADEINGGMQQFQQRPLKRLYDLGLFSSRLQCIHMTEITDEDIAILQKTGAHVIHCPESNLKLASGFCPVKKLMDAGINIALGTDGAASNNDLDMFAEVQTAALLAKAVAKDPTALNAADALRMATLNGAKALGLEKEIGSLIPGKAADFIAVDLASVNTQPLYNPISQLVYSVNSRQVTDVWVAGKQLLKARKFCHWDEKTILAKAQEWRDKIKNE